MTNKELNAAIKADLKEAGYSVRDFSVRVRDSLYDTAVSVKIKNPKIRKTEICNILSKWEEIDRDTKTFEILAGGNRYIFVDYVDGLLADVSSGLIPIAEKVLANPEKYSGQPIADNKEKAVSIHHYSSGEWVLYESKKDNSDICIYKPSYWIKCAEDLASAMWRFKNIGTIYA